MPMTGEGLALSPTHHLLWQPLSPYRLDAWEEFTVRLRDDQVRCGACDWRCFRQSSS